VSREEMALDVEGGVDDGARNRQILL
jgi:hypothetical protein